MKWPKPFALMGLIFWICLAHGAQAQVFLCEQVFSAVNSDSGADIQRHILRSATDHLQRQAEDLVKGREQIRDPAKRDQVLREAQVILEAHGIETKSGDFEFEARSCDGLHVEGTGPSFLAMIARHIQRRSPGTQVVVSLEAGARGFVSGKNSYFGVSLETALKVAQGDLESMSVLIHELTHFTNLNLRRHKDDRVRERGRLETTDLRAPENRTLPGVKNLDSPYAKFFRFDEMAAHETQARWMWQYALRGKVAQPLGQIARSEISPNFKSLQIFYDATAALLPALKQFWEGLNGQIELPSSGETVEYHLGRRSLIRLLTVATTGENPGSLGPESVVIGFEVRSQNRTSVEVATVEIPLTRVPTLDGLREPGIEFVESVGKLIQKIEFHHRRFEAWTKIFHDKPKSEPFTTAELRALLAN